MSYEDYRNTALQFIRRKLRLHFMSILPWHMHIKEDYVRLESTGHFESLGGVI